MNKSSQRQVLSVADLDTQVFDTHYPREVAGQHLKVRFEVSRSHLDKYEDNLRAVLTCTGRVFARVVNSWRVIIFLFFFFNFLSFFFRALFHEVTLISAKQVN